MVSGRSAARATWYGLPLSRASSWASSSAFFSIRSASLYIRLPRCAAVSFLRQGPLSKAPRAADTALSTSAASASATWAMVSPVDGLMVGNVLPDTASVHLLLMSSFVALTLTVGSTAVEAVAMKSLLQNLCSRRCQEGRGKPLRARRAQTGRGYRLEAGEARMSGLLSGICTLQEFEATARLPTRSPMRRAVDWAAA